MPALARRARPGQARRLLGECWNILHSMKLLQYPTARQPAQPLCGIGGWGAVLDDQDAARPHARATRLGIQRACTRSAQSTTGRPRCLDSAPNTQIRTVTGPAQQPRSPPIAAGQRTIIKALRTAGCVTVRATARREANQAAYLCIAALRANVRFCRIVCVGLDHHGAGSHVPRRFRGSALCMISQAASAGTCSSAAVRSFLTG